MTSSLDMIRGRSNVVTLTNNSGGGLVAGDVCVQDTSADEKVTTTTSAASTLKIFVAAETIASGAAGKFYESGYCPLVNVNASVTRGRFLFTHTVAKQAAENATYGSGAFGKILKSGTTPSAIIYSATAQIGSSGVTRSGGTTDGHLAVWNGSSADSIKDGGVISSGALVLLEQHAGAGVTTPTLDFTTWYSASYDSYLIDLVNVIPATNAVALLMQYSTDGGSTWDTTAGNYVGGGLLAHSGGVGAVNLGGGYLITANVGNSSTYGVTGTVTIHSPGSTALYKDSISRVSYYDSAAAHAVMIEGTVRYLVTTAINGIRFNFSSGDVTSGTIRIYGIAK